jgi:hypothetical protein
MTMPTPLVSWVKFKKIEQWRLNKVKKLLAYRQETEVLRKIDTEKSFTSL